MPNELSNQGTTRKRTILQRMANVVHFTITILPATWIVLFYALMYSVVLRLHHWPIRWKERASISIPDMAPYTQIESALGLIAISLFFLGPIWLWMSLCMLDPAYKFRNVTRFLIFVIGLAAILVAMFVDPHNLFQWYLD